MSVSIGYMFVTG